MGTEREALRRVLSGYGLNTTMRVVEPEPVRALEHTCGITLPVTVRYVKALSGRALEVEVCVFVGKIKMTLSPSEWSAIPALSAIAEGMVRGELPTEVTRTAEMRQP